MIEPRLQHVRTEATQLVRQTEEAAQRGAPPTHPEDEERDSGGAHPIGHRARLAKADDTTVETIAIDVRQQALEHHFGTALFQTGDEVHHPNSLHAIAANAEQVSVTRRRTLKCSSTRRRARVPIS